MAFGINLKRVALLRRRGIYLCPLIGSTISAKGWQPTNSRFSRRSSIPLCGSIFPVMGAWTVQWDALSGVMARPRYVRGLRSWLCLKEVRGF